MTTPRCSYLVRGRVGVVAKVRVRVGVGVGVGVGVQVRVGVWVRVRAGLGPALLVPLAPARLRLEEKSLHVPRHQRVGPVLTWLG